MRLLVIAVCVAGIGAAVARGAADLAPRAAFAPVKLYPLSQRAKVQCDLAKPLARCPTRLPRASIAFRAGQQPPPLYAERYRPTLNGGALLVGMSFSYGAPFEPDSGPGWRSHLWRNRPCCFFHFELWRSLRGKPPFPEKYGSATIAGHRGDLAPATGYGLACGRGNAGVFFCNHLRFRWRERGTWFVATLHRFGDARETRLLLTRILRTLRPA